MTDFRVIPSIDELRRSAAARALEAEFGPDATLDALRDAAADLRAAIAGGNGDLASEADAAARIETAAAARLRDAFRPSLQPVINATGVVIHTNLGRAPLAPAAIERIAAVARGYSSLEYDIARGARGRRDVHAERLLCRVTGAEAAVVVNNNAAAALIVLAALAAGREVIVSRGELVEIGGGFRVPDVMAQSGAVLREVGTTNKTRAADYAAAINDKTALILRVHPSNFRIEGFTERPRLTDLVTLARKFNIPVAEDLGSGHLGSEWGRSAVGAGSDPVGMEPAAGETIAGGADLCFFSGDKLLGGPQAGIIVGRAALVDRVRRHPLMRALRVDKMTYAALDATLTEYAAGRAAATIPVQRMLAASGDDIRARADAVASAIRAIGGWRAEPIEGASAVGGGSAPGVALPTWLVAVEKDGLSADALESRLRQLAPPIVARIERDRLVLDLRTVSPEQDGDLPRLLARVG
ncbi:MAG: L-seryl-tRNA(Sec) selenium transferase [Acidobacteria bacterium]|nr:MAG: L-seryl-tRNA(Sec) selenium transferase [Acidobacteriota bacterium]